MKPEIVSTRGLLPPPIQAELEERFTVHRLWEAADRERFLAARAERVQGIATTGTVGADAALMDALPNCEIIAVYGVGVDAVDLTHARTRGIVVTSTPGVLTDDVADMAMANWLALAINSMGADASTQEPITDVPKIGAPGEESAQPADAQEPDAQGPWKSSLRWGKSAHRRR